MPMILNTITAGDLREDWKVYSIRTPGKKVGRGKNQKPTSAIQKDRNYRNAMNKIERLACANFTHNDLLISLNHTEETLPEAYEDAERELKNFLRRLDYRRKKAGLPPAKYMGTIEFYEQRCNYHITITATDLNMIIDAWGKGGVNIKQMWKGSNFRGLTNYMTKEAEKYRPPNKRRWIQSRNLTQPTASPPKIVGYTYELKTPKGYVKIDSQVYATEYGYAEYAKYIRLGGMNYGTGKASPTWTKAIKSDQRQEREEAS